MHVANQKRTVSYWTSPTYGRIVQNAVFGAL